VADVLGDGLERQPARLLSLGPAADAVGHHHQEGEPFGLCRQAVDFRQAGQADHHQLLQRTDEKVVLVFGANLPGMGDSVHIDLIVSRLAGGSHSGCGHLRGSHADLLFAEISPWRSGWNVGLYYDPGAIGDRVPRLFNPRLGTVWILSIRPAWLWRARHPAVGPKRTRDLCPHY
jgi:hypothetical protein